MAERQLLDTDVIVDYLRGVSDAIDYIEHLPGTLFLSSISVAELFSGVREGAERTALQTFLGAFEVVPVDREIAERGGLYRRQYGPSHALGLADALIAATADHVGAELVTLNGKHFPMFPGLRPPYRKP
jgi:predicted nucleic acid-binding protein